jgi:hypothetical protein
MNAGLLIQAGRVGCVAADARAGKHIKNELR